LFNVGDRFVDELRFKEILELLIDFRKTNDLFKSDVIVYYFPKKLNGNVILERCEVKLSDLNLVQKGIYQLHLNLNDEDSFIKLFNENEISYLMNCIYINNYPKVRNYVLNFKNIYNLHIQFLKTGIISVINRNGEDVFL
jgi:hypothetical protein